MLWGHRLFSVLIIASLLAVVWLVTVPTERDGFGRVERADSTADWLVTHAATTGSDPYADIRDLADRAGHPYVPAVAALPETIVHPRLPGALVLMLPSQIVTPVGWFWVMSFASALSAAAIVVWLRAHFAVPAFVAWAAAAFFAVAAPSHSALFFGTQSFVIAAAVVYAWTRLRGGDDVLSGIVIGAVLCLKVYPALIAVGLLLTGRRRAAGACAAAFVILNGVALALFRIDPVHAQEALGGAADRWIPFLGNGSLSVILGRSGFAVPTAAVLSWLVGLLLFLALMRLRPGTDLIMVAAVAIGLLISPVSWEHYVVVGVPAAAVAWVVSGGVLVRAAAVGWFAIFLLGEPITRVARDPTRATGELTFLGGVILTLMAIVAVVLAARAERGRARLPTSAVAPESQS